VARIAALIPDLLFGSKVQGLLEQAGHEVDLIGSEVEARYDVAPVHGSAGTGDAAGETRWACIDVLVVDLVSADVDGVTLLETLRSGGELHGVRTLATYSHVDADMRRRALDAGFDLVVPRSRMMREGGDLLAQLAGA
jgi:CheY-like chemotaxis protein